jgi:hypothetical protein
MMRRLRHATFVIPMFVLALGGCTEEDDAPIHPGTYQVTHQTDDYGGEVSLASDTTLTVTFTSDGLTLASDDLGL